MTSVEAQEFAHHWIKAWNAHELDKIMSHYAPQVVLVSPTVVNVLDVVSGTIEGKEALCHYFEKGIEAYPNLTFELVDVMVGLSSLVLYYVNQKGTKTGEFMEFNEDNKVIKVVANYSH